MLRSGALGRRVCKGAAIGLAAAFAATAMAGTADARARHHRHHHARAAESYDPAYASIAVDANTGAVLQATNADSPRHPASLTKIMTLYLLFERLEAGKIKMSTEMPVSAHAAAQEPSKLGLKPGQTIEVETAIRAIVTKSANDVAVIVAEALAGSEEEFARQMTAKARALGMMHTFYRDASGLPNDQQITTARDMAILGRAIQDRFPKFYHYFSTRTFAFHGKVMRNHNHLLGNVDGVDGIKTGYIHDSGFNIVTSVHRGNRHIVAVVFGGRTANARDARMRDLIANTISVASIKRTAPPVVEGWETAAARAKDNKVVPAASSADDGKERLIAAHAAPRSAEPAVGSTDPIKPNTVKTFSVESSAMRTASATPPTDIRKLMATPANARSVKVTTVAIVKKDPPSAVPDAPAAQPVKVASAGDVVPTTDSGAKPRNGGWMIQVGAFDDEAEAKQRLVAARGRAKDQLDQADSFTERVAKGEKSLFRARFAGLDKDQAETACKNLKRSEIPCMLLKN